MEVELERLRAEVERLKEEVVTVSSETSDVRKEIAEANSEADQFKSHQRIELETAKNFSEIETYHSDLVASREFLEERIGVWKKATRESLVGRALENIRLTSGRVIAKARLAAIDDDTVTLELPTGTEAFAYDELPIDLRRNLVHEETIRVHNRLQGTAP